MSLRRSLEAALRYAGPSERAAIRALLAKAAPPAPPAIEAEPVEPAEIERRQASALPPVIARTPAPIAAPDREAEAIAKYIAEKGVTRVAPAFAAPTPNAALDGAAAKRAIDGFAAYYENASAELVARELRRLGVEAWAGQGQCRLRGETCSYNDLVAAANPLRRAAGLLPFRAAAARAVA